IRIAPKPKVAASSETLERTEQSRTHGQATGAAASLTLMVPQLLMNAPIILVSLVGAVVCLLRRQQAPTAALFGLIGFGLIGCSSLFGIIAYGLIFDAMRTDRESVATVLSGLGIIRVLVTSAGLVFLLIAVFSGRGQKAQQP